MTACLLVGLSCIQSADPALSVVSVINPAICVLVLLCSRLLDMEEFWLLILCYCGTPTALSVAHFFLSLQNAPEIARNNLPLFRHEVVGLTGIRSGEHPLGLFAIAPSFLILIVLFRKKMSAPELSVVGIATACALLTFSRGVYLSFFVGAIVIAYALIGKESKRQLVLLVCVAGIAIIALLAVPPIRHGILMTAHMYSNASQERSTSGRVALYQVDLFSLKNANVLGTGPGTYGLIRNGRQFQSLNSFIQISAEYGIFTLFACVFFVASEVKATFCILNDRMFKYAVLAVFLSTVVINSTWSALLTERPTMMLVALFLAFLRAVQVQTLHEAS